MSEGAHDDPTLFAPIERYVAELATMRRLPDRAVALCTLRYREAGPILRAALSRAAEGEIDNDEVANLAFRALFIAGGCRDPLAFEPLLRLLHRPIDDVDWLLGDHVTETLSRIAIGTFDGSTEATLIDLSIDEFVREALFGAATFLTWEGRIERSRMVQFLERFGSEQLAPNLDYCWAGWMMAVALLGLRDMAPAVMRAWDRGAIDSHWMSRKEFAIELAEAERSPGDMKRFADANLGYIEDVLQELQKFADMDDDAPDELSEALSSLSPPFGGEPVINAWRHVGRNDPCPCGSGKKAKRCCLTS